jgi:site-specific DNA-methyltransferase (adenine-specific)
MQERTGAGLSRVKYELNHRSKSTNYRDFEGREGVKKGALRVPSSWQKFNTEVGLHPNQKPVPLIEYIVKTYSNEGEIVLDNTAGSGTTAIACINTNRNYIVIENEKEYFDKMVDRIENHLKNK